MKVTWKPELLTRPRIGLLDDEEPAILWLELGARGSDDSALLVEIQLPAWWPTRRRLLERRP